MSALSGSGIELMHTEVNVGGKNRTVTTVKTMTEQFIVVDRLASCSEVALKIWNHVSQGHEEEHLRRQAYAIFQTLNLSCLVRNASKQSFFGVSLDLNDHFLV